MTGRHRAARSARSSFSTAYRPASASAGRHRANGAGPPPNGARPRGYGAPAWLAGLARREGTGAARPTRRRLWWMVSLLATGQMLLAVDNSILQVAVETLADPVRGLGASAGQLQWAIGAYTLVFAAAMLAGGALGDRYGPRRILVIGLVVFGVASAAAAFSAGPTTLILARGAMGAGGALFMPATLSIIVRAATAETRARAIAIWASSNGVGVAIGPVAGGALLDHFWWGSVFLVNLPIVLLLLAGIAAVVPEFPDPARRPLDPAGLLLSFGGLFGVVYGLIRWGDGTGWTSPGVFGPIVAGVALLAIFLGVQLGSGAPSFDARLFAHRQFAAGCLGLFLAFFALAGQAFYGNFYLQGVRSMSALAAGLAMLPSAVGVVLGNQAAPALMRRFPIRSVVTAGALCLVVCHAAHLLFDAGTPLLWYEVAQLLLGLGIGLISTPTTTTMMTTLPRERTGAGSAINSVMRQLGTTFGIAVLGSILAAAYRRGIGPMLAGLPGDVRDEAQQSAEATRHAAAELGRPALVAAADQAYLHAMVVTAACTCALTLIGAGLIFRWLSPPRR